MTPADLLDQQLRRDGTRPLLTWYDDATGERIELSVATAAQNTGWSPAMPCPSTRRRTG